MDWIVHKASSVTLVASTLNSLKSGIFAQIFTPSFVRCVLCIHSAAEFIRDD